MGKIGSPLIVAASRWFYGIRHLPLSPKVLVQLIQQHARQLNGDGVA